LFELVLHLGSNLGSRIKNISLAKLFIEQKIGKILKCSSLYETEAWGVTDQAKFINLALQLETDLDPLAVLEEIHWIEDKLGRERNQHWGERTIDIDILFFGDQIIKKANLKIPHPEITNRNFVLVPLEEIIPDHIHPEIKKTIRELKEECQDTSKVWLYKE
jgi:2-amino-4-hydroxy-6-hydroxymethyldihydropteridine diphosphokinase